MENKEGLTVSVRKTPDGLLYAAGVELDGFFATFAEWPAGNLDARIADYKAQNPTTETPDTPVEPTPTPQTAAPADGTVAAPPTPTPPAGG